MTHFDEAAFRASRFAQENPHMVEGVIEWERQAYRMTCPVCGDSYYGVFAGPIEHVSRTEHRWRTPSDPNPMPRMSFIRWGESERKKAS